MYSAVLHGDNVKETKGIFCFRGNSFLDKVPKKYQADYMSENPSSSKKMEELKKSIKEKCPPEWILENYNCEWKGIVDGKPCLEIEEAFKNHVLEMAWKHFRYNRNI
jgi:hypothetical protein